MNISTDKNFIKNPSSSYFFNKEILEALPLNIRELFIKIPLNECTDIEEIRLRISKPLMIYKKNKDYFINKNGTITTDLLKGYIVSQEDIRKSYQLITNYSVYALEEEIKNGFITLKGGHRVGICGKTILDKDGIKSIQDISGLNIRIAKQKIGISDHLMKYLIDGSDQFYNSLIVSSPQCGKTTLLRDIIRNLSNGMKNLNFEGVKVGVVDERSEICGVCHGIAQNDVGVRTDVLDSCPKADGVMMLIRSMSPQVIATDEIGKKEDANAIEEALNAGVKLITTVHGNDIEDLDKRPYIKPLLAQKIFARIIVLSNNPKVGTIKQIIDGKTNKVIVSYPN